MTLILASRPNVYANSPLDRLAPRRDDPAWVAERLADPDSLFIPVWRSRNLVRGHGGEEPEAVYISGATAHTLRMAHGEDDAPWAFLGILETRAVFAIDISAAEDPVPLLPPELGTFVDLRAVGWGVPRPEASVLAHARGLMHWRQRHRFCGVCGNPCEIKSAGHMMQCTVCNAQHFPRTDPAVIMLVHRGDKALLGHSTRFPRATMYSTLAGFVEPGETLEEAVRREVLEESGIQCGAVHYHSSQPWPFPGNIMLGFYAEGLTEEITLQDDELKDARWFSRAEMRNHKALGFDLPRVDSIARRLIEDWLAHG
ncbi:NAD(+) diphosphatase [Rhodopila sp.]|uniref:NAD(+) diphosphatase n=1 Tax=Rhodopila sp. TaxID=2480087 RepID=UPI002CEFC69C|nr:NAD(+) diphosphatase [Rhodopila sp.]HVZ08556.1 NAD(+) diphosphatase [Rhodopila sp.]